jgi:hypothetical protein
LQVAAQDGLNSTHPTYLPPCRSRKCNTNPRSGRPLILLWRGVESAGNLRAG